MSAEDEDEISMEDELDKLFEEEEGEEEDFDSLFEDEDEEIEEEEEELEEILEEEEDEDEIIDERREPALGGGFNYGFIILILGLLLTIGTAALKFVNLSPLPVIGEYPSEIYLGDPYFSYHFFIGLISGLIVLIIGVVATVKLKPRAEVVEVEEEPEEIFEEEFEEEEEVEEGICPTCGAVIPIDSEECPECGEELAPHEEEYEEEIEEEEEEFEEEEEELEAEEEELEEEEEFVEEETVECPICGAEVSADADECPECGEPLGEIDEEDEDLFADLDEL
ncbi:MAG: double zinc ribbon domain-containing protein [Thermoplasmatota archaeon]